MVEVGTSNQHQFVDERVSREKFDKQVASFESQSSNYRRKGVVCLKIEFPIFEFAFISKYSIISVHATQGVSQHIASYPSLLFAVRMDYSNYDTVPPALSFIDPISSEINPNTPQCKFVISPNQQNEKNIIDQKFKTQSQNILLRDNEGKLFICLRGLREYHNHPQHDGDSWFLHREHGLGEIETILDQIHLYSLSNLHNVIETQLKINF